MFGARIIQAQLEAVLAESDGVKTRDDIENVHRMRVATRRMRAVLPIFGQYLEPKHTDNWIKAFRGITKALGIARDLDVQLEKLEKTLETASPENKPGIERLILRWTQRRDKAQEPVIRAVDKFLKSGIVQQVAGITAPLVFFSNQIDLHDEKLVKLGVTHIRQELSEMLKYDRDIQDPEKVTELHQMRIQAKRLRYSMETFAPVFPNELSSQLKLMKQIQDLVGETHDADVWLMELPKFLEEERALTMEFLGEDSAMNQFIPGINAFMQAESEDRVIKYTEFIALWEKTKTEEIWQQFFNLLEASLQEARSAGENPNAAPIEDPAELS